ncbi:MULTISPECIES: hypothetical protein [unclassified Xanthobacter]|uniref:hypothetical protein n=1 Tax=Xanthobacter TaxID=279 RepID=UPI001F221E83|nr:MULTISPECIES: hypothetical protein [unclassified Xanthobacter]
MPVDGIYQITVKTPLGPQDAQMTLRAEGTDLSGFIENAKGRSEFSGGTVDGAEFRFSARIGTPIGRVHADIQGRVDGDQLSATAKLPLGTADIQGARI